jgi:glucose-6-phosphate-specific signal transduction histidine kinase
MAFYANDFSKVFSTLLEKTGISCYQISQYTHLNQSYLSRLKRIDKYAAKGKLGIIGMRQRINFISGTLQIRSKLGKGTRLAVKVKC